MTKNKQINVRLPYHTHEQLGRLATMLGMTKTQTLILAIDRLDSQERDRNGHLQILHSGANEPHPR